VGSPCQARTLPTNRSLDSRSSSSAFRSANPRADTYSAFRYRRSPAAEPSLDDRQQLGLNGRSRCKSIRTPRRRKAIGMSLALRLSVAKKDTTPAKGYYVRCGAGPERPEILASEPVKKSDSPRNAIAIPPFRLRPSGRRIALSGIRLTGPDTLHAGPRDVRSGSGAAPLAPRAPDSMQDVLRPANRLGGSPCCVVSTPPILGLPLSGSHRRDKGGVGVYDKGPLESERRSKKQEPSGPLSFLRFIGAAGPVDRPSAD